MSKHTPGPWKYRKTTLETRAIDRKWEIVSQCSEGGELVVVGSHTGIDCLSETNVRLIAAAPELLEKLEWLCNIVQHPSTTKASMRQIAMECRVVIRQATSIAAAEGCEVAS